MKKTFTLGLLALSLISITSSVFAAHSSNHHTRKAQSSATQNHDNQDNNDKIDNNLLNSDAFNITPILLNKKGEGFLEFLPTYASSTGSSEMAYPVSADIGLTDHIALETSWTPHSVVKANGEPSVSGIGDLYISAQYHPNKQFLWKNFQYALGITSRFPVADVNKGLTDGFFAIGPYLVLQQGIPQLHNLQLYTQIGVNFVSRWKTPASSIPPAANELAWDTGLALPLGKITLSTDLLWFNNEWSHGGKINELLLAPGVLWQNSRFELGIHTPIGLNRTAPNYSIIGVAGISFP